MRHMRSGNWQAAWHLSDEVLRRRRELAGARLQLGERHLQSVWGGEPLKDRTVLVHCYHGLGDTVQFIRFLPHLRQIAARTIVWAQPPLLPLIETVEGIDVLLPLHDGDPGVDRDVDIEVMELPHALRVAPEDLARMIPYLHVGEAARQRPNAPRHPEASSPAAARVPVVGVVWQAGPWDTRRSIRPAAMERLIRLDGFDWVIFQRGTADLSGLHAIARVPDISGIMEEARALRQIDLLISVDTLSAHLAGALGVPTWTLLPREADWRWMQDRGDTPWYPTMRLFRQRTAGDWHSVLEEVARALRAWQKARPWA
jgi:hypothetical protein